MANTADDEWEYEYDENETEDFYIPIDLGNVPNAQGPASALPKTGRPTLLKNKLRALNAERMEGEASTNLTSLESPTAAGEIQLIGLHTSNPLVMYNGQLLSCQWASTIGTDLLFTKPDSNNSDVGPPLRSLPSVDLLATSSAKLVAKVARLRPRDSLFDKENDQHQNTESTETSQGLKNTATEAMQTEVQESEAAPSNFLAKLNAAKAKRGDNSRLIISNTCNGPRLVAKEEYEGEEDVVMSGV